MREANLVVTHGGHGTIARALTHRLPMLVVPHGRDQNDNAVRVTHRGAGLSLPPSASVAEIRAALERLLDEPAFRRAAGELGDAVAHEAENSPVVELLEILAPAPAPMELCPA
jgi:UDP:flavonoid glycosyltransferase YjiC (YdhE family)